MSKETPYGMRCVASLHPEQCPIKCPQRGCSECRTSVCTNALAFASKNCLIGGVSFENVDELEKTPKLIAYTDGSFNKATNTYGYGVVYIIDGEIEEYSGSGNDPVTAAMYQIGGEILAACYAINKAKKLGAKEITIYYDYLGIENWANGNWKAKNDRTKAYVDFVRKSNIKINFQKVKAHSGDKYNDMADKLAKKGAGICC